MPGGVRHHEPRARRKRSHRSPPNAAISPIRSPSSRVPRAASGAASPRCSPPRARASSSPTSTGRPSATAAALRVEGRDARASATDVTDAAPVEALAAAALAAYGRIDILAANAGIYPSTELAAIDDAPGTTSWTSTSRARCTPSRPALPAMLERGYGRIVLTSSITGPITGQPGYAHYGASKAAMLGLMRSAAIELATSGVTVNAVMPGNVETPGLGETSEEHQRLMLSSIPMGASASRRTSAGPCASWPRARPATSPGRRWSSTAARSCRSRRRRNGLDLWRLGTGRHYIACQGSFTSPAIVASPADQGPLPATMFANFLIGLREGLEAALVVSILIAYLVRTGRRDRLPRSGSVSGRGRAVAWLRGAAHLHLIAAHLRARRRPSAGSMSIIAVGFVTWMIFWMRRTARDVAGETSTASSTRRSAVGPVAVAVVGVPRRRRARVWRPRCSSGRPRRRPAAPAQPLIGSLLGIGPAVVLGWLLYRGAIRINLSRFFTWTGAAPDHRRRRRPRLRRPRPAGGGHPSGPEQPRVRRQQRRSRRTPGTARC